MARLKIIDHYDASFSLEPEAQAVLFDWLQSAEFLSHVGQQAQSSVEFTGKLFQPVPYSSATPKGMPVEFEPFHESPDYLVINVPPPLMFKAKIFKPSRLCAIYRKTAASERDLPMDVT